MTVRLACVKHTASVHPEPGSNSPWYFPFLSVVSRLPLYSVKFFTFRFDFFKLFAYPVGYPSSTDYSAPLVLLSISLTRFIAFTKLSNYLVV